ncbi:MAG: HAMP domain-containing sensor histidine kinase [Myxococcota bacterium]
MSDQTGARAAWLETDEEGRILRLSGDFEGLWGRRPQEGSLISDEFPGILDLPLDGLHLPTLSLLDGVVFDLVVVPTRSGRVLTAVERIEGPRLEQRFQQERLELELELERFKREFELALVGSDMTVFKEQVVGGGFTWLGPERQWVRDRFGTAIQVGGVVDLRRESDFLATLLEEMDGRPSLEGLDSVPFYEADGPLLQAKLMKSGLASRVLVLARHRDGHAPGLGFLQSGRELQLEQEALLRLLEERDVLVHCVVHDLQGPLHAVGSALVLLQESAPSKGEDAELLQLAVQETERQVGMVREIEQIFQPSSEAAPLEDVDLLDAVSAIFPVVELRWPSVRFVCTETALPTRVAGDSGRMLRVLQNLLDNAARHSPSAGEVQIRFSEPQAGLLRLSVHDSGSGVSGDLDVFERGSKGSRGGRWGLGLFYCKITVERWGGRIGHQPSDLGGEEFWFELPARVYD